MVIQNYLEKVFKISENVVARKIADEIIIVPIVSGIGDIEDELFTLNATGEDIWDKFDGIKDLKEIVAELSVIYEDSEKSIAVDIIGFIKELEKRGIIVEVTR